MVGDRCHRDFDAELAQLPVNPRRTPAWVGGTHSSIFWSEKESDEVRILCSFMKNEELVLVTASRCALSSR